MKLSEFRKDSDYYSSSASSINRSLAFSGIAIIWLFTKSGEDGISMHKILIISLAFLAGSLLIDLFQYCYGFYKWSRFHREQEISAILTDTIHDEEKVEVLAPTGIKKVIDSLFWTKLALNITSYILIIIFLINNIFIQ